MVLKRFWLKMYSSLKLSNQFTKKLLIRNLRDEYYFYKLVCRTEYVTTFLIALNASSVLNNSLDMDDKLHSVCSFTFSTNATSSYSH